MQLFLPALPDVNLAVAHPAAVADHEMISQAVFHPSLAPMIRVHAPRRTLAGRAVMDHDVFPAAGSDRRLVDRLPHRPGQPGGCGRSPAAVASRDHQFLAGPDMVLDLDPVPLRDRVDRHPVSLGDTGQRLAAADDVKDFLGRRHGGRTRDDQAIAGLDLVLVRDPVPLQDRID